MAAAEAWTVHVSQKALCDTTNCINNSTSNVHEMINSTFNNIYSKKKLGTIPNH